MKFIAYRSKVVDPGGAPALLKEIGRRAASKNREFGITGILFYTGDYFLQVIEGIDRHVDQLFTNICADRRHEDVVLLHEGKITHRSLANWNMEVADLKVLNSFTEDQIRRSVEIVQSSMAMDTETFLFLIRELSEEPEFQALIRPVSNSLS